MCKSIAEGGQRCAAHLKDEIKKLNKLIKDANQSEKEELNTKLNDLQNQYLKTRTGISEHLKTTLDTTETYDAQALTKIINQYINNHPEGKSISLPGGNYRVLKAQTYGKHTILEVTGDSSRNSYSKQLKQRYETNIDGKQVTYIPPKRLHKENYRLIILPDGKAGAAIHPNGEISAVFSNSKFEKITTSILPAALDRGGTFLNCFNTYLPKIYQKSGFIKIAAIPFNRDYAPKGWDYEKAKELGTPTGEPDIVFMVSQKQYEKLNKPTFKKFNDYDEALNYTQGKTDEQHQ